MTYAETSAKLDQKRAQIAALRTEMQALQAAIEPQPVSDYEFAGRDGPVRLSQLFGDKDDLFVIHNMGTGCSYCTMWADGFNGVYEHLADRAGFVLTSPNPPAQQKPFAASRGWRFPMVSHQGTTFAADMGYLKPGGDPFADTLGGWYPGLSVFQRRGESIVRVSDTELGPGDDFCLVWHMLSLLPQGPSGWEPKFRYAKA
jgi:predicted dithiol-disulfide oxidoreductase (DUF899 family)